MHSKHLLLLLLSSKNVYLSKNAILTDIPLNVPKITNNDNINITTCCNMYYQYTKRRLNVL